MKEKMKKVLKSNKGFTMIELMVVIVIMLILAAIAIPSFNTLIDKANTTAATAEARTVLTLATLDYELDGVMDEWDTSLEDAGITDNTSYFSYAVVDGTVYVKYEDGGISVELPDTTNTEVSWSKTAETTTVP